MSKTLHRQHSSLIVAIILSLRIAEKAQRCPPRLITHCLDSPIAPKRGMRRPQQTMLLSKITFSDFALSWNRSKVDIWEDNSSSHSLERSHCLPKSNLKEVTTKDSMNKVKQMIISNCKFCAASFLAALVSKAMVTGIIRSKKAFFILYMVSSCCMGRRSFFCLYSKACNKLCKNRSYYISWQVRFQM